MNGCGASEERYVVTVLYIFFASVFISLLLGCTILLHILLLALIVEIFLVEK